MSESHDSLIAVILSIEALKVKDPVLVFSLSKGKDTGEYISLTLAIGNRHANFKDTKAKALLVLLGVEDAKQIIYDIRHGNRANYEHTH